jgi:hypothetical protein
MAHVANQPADHVGEQFLVTAGCIGGVGHVSHIFHVCHFAFAAALRRA